MQTGAFGLEQVDRPRPMPSSSERVSDHARELARYQHPHRPIVGYLLRSVCFLYVTVSVRLW